MHQRRAILLFFLLGALGARAQEDAPWIIESQDAVDYDLTTGIATATNGIVVRHGTTLLTARRGQVNQLSGEVQAEGDVRLSHSETLWQGERVRYNFFTRRFVGDDVATAQPPLFLRGSTVVGDISNRLAVAAQAMLTTDDYATPGYSVRAKTMTVVPGEYVEARNATLRLGDVPVFWLPYFKKSFGSHRNYWLLAPGARSRYGLFLRSTYHWYWNERLDADLHFDGFLRRGVGVGPDLNWHLPRFGEGTAKYYYIRDQDPGTDPNGQPIRTDRQRFWWSHRGELVSNLTFRTVLAKQSDAQVIRDFFEPEYRANVQPNTFVEVNQAWPNFTLDLLGQPRVNDFFETVERLPDVKLTGLRQQVLATPLYYESETSAGWYRRKFPDESTNAPFSAARADTFHQVVLPWNFFGWLNVVPRAGGRFTHYGEADGAGATTTEENRGVFNTGADVSLRGSRLWTDSRSKFWQVDGLRHIIEPTLNYVYVPAPTVRPRDLPQFDYLVPTTRLLPIDYPQFNAIDAVDAQNVLRPGLRNKLQTRRDGGIDNLVNWAVVTDWRLDPQPGQPTFSDLYSDLDLKPFRWLTLSSGLRLDIASPRFNETDHSATFAPNDVWSLRVGHHYVRSVPGQGADSGYQLYYGSIFFRFDQNWAGRISLLHQEGDGDYNEHYLTVYRDFRSWVGAVTLRVRDQSYGPAEYTVAVTFSLKAFPRFRTGQDASHPNLLLGG